MSRSELIEYNSWRSMRQRCANPNATHYLYYGGKGIKVCDRWNDFNNFYRDMGSRPTPEHTLDRIDSSKDYTPENCRWATKQEQVLNRKMDKRNMSGHTGITWHRLRNKWVARLTRDNKQYNIGIFPTIEEAVRARDNFIEDVTNVSPASRF